MKFNYILAVEINNYVHDFNVLEDVTFYDLSKMHDRGELTEYEYVAIKEEIKRVREGIKEK